MRRKVAVLGGVLLFLSVAGAAFVVRFGLPTQLLVLPEGSVVSARVGIYRRETYGPDGEPLVIPGKEIVLTQKRGRVFAELLAGRRQWMMSTRIAPVGFIDLQFSIGNSARFDFCLSGGDYIIRGADFETGEVVIKKHEFEEAFLAAVGSLSPLRRVPGER